MRDRKNQKQLKKINYFKGNVFYRFTSILKEVKYMELNEDWLEFCQNGELEELREHYISVYMNLLDGLTSEELQTECISGMNRITRYKTLSCDELGIIVNVGDICFFDYGHAYKNESGFQHLGLVIGVFNYKVCVVPMTSSVKSMAQARNVSKKARLIFTLLEKLKDLQNHQHYS